MNMEEEEFSPFGGFTSGCDIHGEDSLRECTMCGIEFCSACFPQSALCSDCAAQGDLDDEEEEPIGEEKELLLLAEFNDDEPADADEEIPPPSPPVKKSARPSPVKGKGKVKTSKKAPSKITAPSHAKHQKAAATAPVSKAKAKSPSKGKAKPAPKKTAKNKTQKKR